jgi:pyruvate,orthophosphate dikinase
MAKTRKQTKRKAAPAKASGKYVYFFGRKTDGNGTMKPLLGGKGANLAEMCRIGLPVPPGFTITTDVCTYYYAHGRSYPPR